MTRRSRQIQHPHMLGSRSYAMWEAEWKKEDPSIAECSPESRKAANWIRGRTKKAPDGKCIFLKKETQDVVNKIVCILNLPV
jgi:hypothetical protein